MNDNPEIKAATSPTRRKQADRRAESQRGLVRAVVEIIPERGVSAATFEAIGAQAGYHRSLVTQRFGSKRGLIDSVIEYVHGTFGENELDHLADQLSGLEGLLLLLDAYLTRLASSGELRTYFMLLASAVAEVNELRTAFATQHELVKDRLGSLVTKGQADGSIRSGLDAASAALMIGSLQLGIAVQLLVDPHMDMDPVRRTTLNTVRLSFGV